MTDVKKMEKLFFEQIKTVTLRNVATDKKHPLGIELIN